MRYPRIAGGRRRTPFGLIAAALLLGAAPAVAGYSSTSLIDVPASEYLDHLQYEGDLVVAISGDETISNYGVFNFNVGVGGMSEVGLAVYSFWDEAVLGAHFKLEVIDEEHFSRYQPAVSLGMDNLTVGEGLISHAGSRLPKDTAVYDMDFRDNVSPFVVASKTVEPLGTFHLGWGYGRFVGKGPLSEKLHGVFGGYNRRVWKTFEVMVEADGRDVNFGVRHVLPWITVGAAVEKAEQLGSESFHPYYSLTIEFSPRPLHTGPERLAVRRRIRDFQGRVNVLQRRVDHEQELVSSIRQRIYDLSEEYGDQGIETTDLDRVYAEIEDLERALEAEETPPEETSGGDVGI